MIKIIILALTGGLLLAGCSSPNYGEDKNREYNSTISSTEVVSLYGVVVAITEDNQLQIKVKKSAEVEDSGLQMNEDGIVKVALAATNVNGLNSEENEALNALLNSNILNDDVMIEVIDPRQSKGMVEGFVSYAGENDSIVLLQDMLHSNFENGLIDNEVLASFKPHLASIQERAKSEIMKMLKEIKQ